MKKIPLVDLAAQYKEYRHEIDKAIRGVCEEAAFIMGPEIPVLEERLAAYCGAPHCITCANGTDALILALRALDIGPGDEVITTAFSFVATAEAIAVVGATPVFVDIEEDTCLIDASRIEERITPRTRAIIAVSLYGQCPDMDTLNAIATRYHLTLIEDAAQSFGSSYRNAKSCALSPIAVTSFFPAKPLGCYGDGGAVFTYDSAIATRIASLRLHGQTTRRYHHRLIGMNSRLDTIQAAILLVKLSHFPDEVTRRSEIALRYAAALTNLPLLTPVIRPERQSVWAYYVIRSPFRDRIAHTLTENGIATAIHYPVPLHLQEAFTHLGYRHGDFPHAEKAASEVLSLPFSAFLTEADQNRVITTIKSAL